METYRDMLGANAIIGMRYDVTEWMTGLTDVLCYGTAVVVVDKESAPRAPWRQASGSNHRSRAGCMSRS